MIFKQKSNFRKSPLYTIVHKLWSARGISIFDLVQKYFKIQFFSVGMHFRGNVDDILWSAMKSKHLMYFSSMPNNYRATRQNGRFPPILLELMALDQRPQFNEFIKIQGKVRRLY